MRTIELLDIIGAIQRIKGQIDNLKSEGSRSARLTSAREGLNRAMTALTAEYHRQDQDHDDEQPEIPVDLRQWR